MSAAALIRELNATGIRLQVRGKRLHVEAPAGTLNEALVKRLADHKAELIELTGKQAIRARLLKLADRLGIDGTHVHRIPSADLTLWTAIPDGSLRAFLLALDDTATLQAGKVPAGETAAIHCARCGPVYVHPSIAAVLPVVDGWPRALGCPWCAIRKAGGYIPRPRVTCETCASYRPDTINPPAGVGDCASGHGMHYPMQRHGCGDHNPRATP